MKRVTVGVMRHRGKLSWSRRLTAALTLSTFTWTTLVPSFAWALEPPSAADVVLGPAEWERLVGGLAFRPPCE